MKKTILLMVCVLSLLFVCSITAFADDGIKVMIDERELAFDQPPVLMNGRTLVPLRAIFEKLGATVGWDDGTQTVTAKKDGTTVKLQINSSAMEVSSSAGTKNVTLDQAAVTLNGRTLAPVRAVSEAFGAAVEWWPNTQTVAIDSDGVYEAKIPYFHDGKLFFNVNVKKTDEIYNNNTCQIYIWDGNEVAKIATPSQPGRVIVKGDYIFYSCDSTKTDYGQSICRVKTDGTEHRVIFSTGKDYFTNLCPFGDSSFFIKDEKIYTSAYFDKDDESNSVLFSMDLDGRQQKKTEIKEYGGIWDFWLTKNASYFVTHYGSGGSYKTLSNDVKVFEISLENFSVKEVATGTIKSSKGKSNSFYYDKIDHETFEVISGLPKDIETIGEVGGWTYYKEDGDLYRENENGDSEFVCQGTGVLFNDFIVQQNNDYDSYNFKTRSYTVDVMDLDGLNPQTIYLYSDNSNFNANNIIDLNATNTAQTCRICGGATTIECRVCDGSGKVRDFSSHVGSLADETGDARYRHCSFCNNGRKDCPGC